MSDDAPSISITLFRKFRGSLTKRIRLNAKGRVISDSSACYMGHGEAKRTLLSGIASLAPLIDKLKPQQALALGALRDDLPDRCEVITKDKLAAINGTPAPHLIARTADAIAYLPLHIALALIDVDFKGAPKAVRERIEAAGGVWKALCSVLPALSETAHLERASTSAGLWRADTKDRLPGSGGMHIYLTVKDGADVERFLTALHEHCWLAGFGWGIAGAAGQFLVRSIVDRMVGRGERLVFEAPPDLEPPLKQDPASRRPIVHPGNALDTAASCPSLTVVERERFKALLRHEQHRLKPEMEQARKTFIDQQAQRLVDRIGLSHEQAERVIAAQCAGLLLPDLVLPFDDDEFVGATVADVLADPAKFDGATLADPLEGPEYGRDKAKIMRHNDGTPWIHSFAHGRTVYELKYDARAIRKAIDAATPDSIAMLFVRLAVLAQLSNDEIEELRNLAATKAGISKTTVKQMLKQAFAEQKRTRERERRERQAAERTDPRPQIPVPLADAPWIPQMAIVNEVLGASKASEPPMRDVDGYVVRVRNRRVRNMHALTANSANAEGVDSTPLPAPEQPLLDQYDPIHLSELIEQYIDYVDLNGRSVHLPSSFVLHYLRRPADDALPVVYGVVTLPLVLGNGRLVSGTGYSKDYQLVFRVAAELLALLPRAEKCNETAVAEEMRFLCDDWLGDVAATYRTKCIIVAAVLTVIERHLLDARPAFLVTAGRRGGGKTTTISMIVTAATGVLPAAALWSDNPEERKKALFSYLANAIPAIVWDNIARGTRVNCPHISSSCTARDLTDRLLGFSKILTVDGATIHFFTGNAIGFGGDMLSRGLEIPLEVTSANPENRHFQHPDPIGWTLANRGRILCAIYTILLANPRVRGIGDNSNPGTRFKQWDHLVGSAVEHAAQCHTNHVKALVMNAKKECPPEPVSFRKTLLMQEEQDEETTDLSEALSAFYEQWPKSHEGGVHAPTAADIGKLINDRNNSEVFGDAQCQRAMVLWEFLFPRLPPTHVVTAKLVRAQLKLHLGNPVKHSVKMSVGGQVELVPKTLVLKAVPDKHVKILRYYVHSTDG